MRVGWLSKQQREVIVARLRKIGWDAEVVLATPTRMRQVALEESFRGCSCQCLAFDTEGGDDAIFLPVDHARAGFRDMIIVDGTGADEHYTFNAHGRVKHEKTCRCDPTDVGPMSLLRVRTYT
jgi:hypothetical protein